MWEVLLMSENSLQPIRYAIQIWVEMSRQYEISVVVPQTPFFFWGGGGGGSGGGGPGVAVESKILAALLRQTILQLF